jgi:hypothetical protein
MRRICFSSDFAKVLSKITTGENLTNVLKCKEPSSFAVICICSNIICMVIFPR